MRRVPNRVSYRVLRSMLSRHRCHRLDQWLAVVWGHIKDRPVNQHEMAVAIRHCSHGKGPGRRVSGPTLAWFLERSPRPDIVTHTRAAKIADEVVERNAGAFKELARH